MWIFPVAAYSRYGVSLKTCDTLCGICIAGIKNIPTMLPYLFTGEPHMAHHYSSTRSVASSSTQTGDSGRYMPDFANFDVFV